MKMTVEEKARAYDEIREKAKVIKECSTNTEVVGYIEELFPEFAESEDEKIRKRIIDALHGDVLEMSEIKEAVDWLEKQGKQKPVMSYDALREGITHFGITQYQIDNWLKKYIDVEKL